MTEKEFAVNKCWHKLRLTQVGIQMKSGFIRIVPNDKSYDSANFYVN